MGFEKFSKKNAPRRRSFTPILTLSKSGMIGLNVAAIEAFDVMSYKYVGLHFDKDRRRIGLELSNEDQDDNFAIRKRRGSGLDVSSKSFMRHYGILPIETQHYKLEKDESTGMLVANMQQDQQGLFVTQ